MKDRFIYIIILNWNGFNDTRQCLRSLLDARDVDYKIVLIDNGSENFEGEKLKKIFPQVKLITNKENEGFCRGNNIAISYCLKQDDCGYIMILNNDTVVDKDFLKPLLNYLKQNPKSIVSPKILHFANPDRVQTMGGKLFLGGTFHIGRNKKSSKFLQIVNPDCIPGACLMARKEAFEKIGLFDESFFAYLEDLDWSSRARRNGFQLVTLPESIIYHNYSQSLKGSYFKVFLIARNNIYFAKKHLKGIKKKLFIFNSILVGFLINIAKYKSPLFISSFARGISEGLRHKINTRYYE